MRARYIPCGVSYEGLGESPLVHKRYIYGRIRVCGLWESLSKRQRHATELGVACYVYQLEDTLGRFRARLNAYPRPSFREV